MAYSSFTTFYQHDILGEVEVGHLHSSIPKKLLPEKTCVITISAMNNFGFVSNLYESTMTNSPSIDCFLWFMGDSSEPSEDVGTVGFLEIKNRIDSKKNFQLITMDQMEQSLEHFHLLKFAFMYDLVELQTTLKPFAFQYTFKELGATAALYLDNDIWVTDSLGEIQHHLTHRSCVITPHYSSPVPEDGKRQEDKDVLASGVFNFGFVSFSNTKASAGFLNWWAEKLSKYGFAVIEKHMFYDQNWGMFIPAFFDHEDYFVIRDLRYNVAYWNLHERGAGLHLKEDGYPYLENPKTQMDERVVFMHFSGMSLLEKYDMDHISRHQNRFSLLDFPRLRAIFDAYLGLVEKHNTIHYREIPYGFNNFTDGSPIDLWMREVYAAAIFPIRTDEFDYVPNPPYETNFSPFLRIMFRDEVFHNPFCASNSCHTDTTKQRFHQWMWDVTADKAVDAKGVFFHSFIERKIWDSRKDLQKIAKYPFEKDFVTWRQWFINHAVNDETISEVSFNQWIAKLEYHVNNHWKFHHKATDDVNQELGLNILGWHAGHFSIGISGTKIIRAAMKVGIDVNAVEIAMPPDHIFKTPDKLDFPLSRSIAHPINFIVVNALDFYIPLDDIPGVIWNHKYNIAYWAWELDKFRPEWMITMSHLDEVWCPSEFIKNAIENSEGYELNPIPVKVLPIPHEKKQIVEKKGEQKSDLLYKIFDEHKKTKSFVFLVAFDFHSYIERKNPEGAIKAFLDAFPAADDKKMKYRLIVKSHFGTSNDIEEMRKVANHDPRVTFLNELLSDSDNQKLYEHQDCFLSLHRSEGYGMVILETLSNGIPVIATDYSGNVDFFAVIPHFHDQCAFPVSYKIVELEGTFGPYEQGNHWAEPNHDSAVEAMRKVVKNDCKRNHGKDISKAILDVFGSEAVGRRMKKMIQESRPALLRKQRPTFKFLKQMTTNTQTFINDRIKKS